MERLLEDLRISAKIQECIDECVEAGLIELIKDDEYLLAIKPNDNVAYELYCSDFTNTRYLDKLTILNMIYADTENFIRCQKYAAMIATKITHGNFDPENDSDVVALICYIFVKVNEYKYANIKSLDDITNEVPFEVFQTIVNNTEGLKVLIEDNGIEFAGELDRINLNKGMFGISVNARIKIVSKGPEYYVAAYHFIDLPYMPFISKLEDLGITEIEDGSKLYNRFVERGRRYVEATAEPKYCEYHGFGYSEGWLRDTRHRIDSRIMVDINAFKMLNSDINEEWYVGNAAYSRNNIGTTLDEKYLWMCSPVVYGFSFGNKIWCRMSIEDISEIKFSDNAFDDLIISEENKAVFIASLTHDMPSLDSIDNKGAGKIFLLYGAPGVGKTMSAESVAEYLQKPLYFVSVGELGTTPSKLEESLDNVMKIASSWDAVILLDEVDVFAVNRIGASIERNAMTAIFLRMLERYSGVMFMTTNLKDNLDPAFISRATATIEYKGLTAQDREAIWNNILRKAESLNQITIDSAVYDLVSEHALIDINGRVIKNTIRLAYTLALSSEDKVLRNEHILMAIKLRG